MTALWTAKFTGSRHEQQLGRGRNFGLKVVVPLEL